jgi:hypothetical protein
MYGTGAAKAFAAAKLGAFQVKQIPQHPKQRHLRIRFDLASLAIDPERE